MIIFDFDGTLIDVWKRYYEIFKNWWNVDIDLDTFKKLKWQSQNETEILKSLGVKFEEDDFLRYKAFKDQKLEDKEFLAFDDLILNPDHMLQLKAQYMILTMRKNVENFLWQMEKLSLDHLFEKRYVILTPKGINTKLEWLKSTKNIDDEITVIGDSETDLKMAEFQAQRVKIDIHLVKTGLRDPYKLIQSLGLKANIIENVNCFFK